MTSRERVVAALNHREPDRVPVDIGGGSSTSISVEANARLQQYLGMEGNTAELSKMFRVAALDERVMQRLGSDCRPLRSKSPRRWSAPPSEPGTLIDIWGVTWKQQRFGEKQLLLGDGAQSTGRCHRRGSRVLSLARPA